MKVLKGTVSTRVLTVASTLLLVVVAVSLWACSSQSISSSRSKSSAGAISDTACQLPSDNFAMAMNERRDYLTLVNDEHKYEFGGSYDQLNDIIYVADCYGGPTPVEKAAYLAFTELSAVATEIAAVGTLEQYLEQKS